MGTFTVPNKTAITSPAADDELLIWVTASAVLRRITRANLIGATLTGGGTIATGGNTLTVAGTSSINGTLSGAGLTLTVPATGTAALLGTAQTFSALKTFSAGINLGNNDLSNYEQNTWTPTITGSSSNPTIAYTTQLGYYTRIGNIVFFEADIAINTYSGGSGNARISLPFTAASGRRPLAEAFAAGVNFGTSATELLFFVSAGVAYGELRGLINNGSPTTVTTGDLAAGDVIRISGWMAV